MRRYLKFWHRRRSRKLSGEVYDFARQLKGQLTAHWQLLEDDLNAHLDIVDCLKDILEDCCSNGMPTGVEVVNAMQHGIHFRQAQT